MYIYIIHNLSDLQFISCIYPFCFLFEKNSYMDNFSPSLLFTESAVKI